MRKSWIATTLLSLGASFGLLADSAKAQYRNYCPPPCYPCPTYPQGAAAMPGQAMPGQAYPGQGATPTTPGQAVNPMTDAQNLAQQAQNAPADDFFAAAGTDQTSSALTYAPNMIGDLLNNSGYVYGTDGYDTYVDTVLPIAGGDRRFKVSENMSPLPRDRISYSYNGFQQAGLTIDGREIDIHRHTFLGEKTFFSGNASFEVRVPVIQGLSADQIRDSNIFNDDAVEFGNMTLIPKFLLSSGDNYVLSTGLGINLPTARDATTLEVTPVASELLIDNQAVHLSPFLGLLVTPNDLTYVLAFTQVDFDTNGSTVYDYTGGVQGAPQGRYQDQTLLHFDVTIGRFLYRDYNARLTGIAPQLELHYTTTIQDSDFVLTNQGIVGNPFNRVDFLTLTAGVNFEFWNRSWLTVACAVPLRDGAVTAFASNPNGPGVNPISISTDRQFDAELQILFNRYF